MAFLNDRCARVPLTPKIVAACAPFSCGNKDLDEFFASDYSDYASQLMGKTYAFLEIDNPREVICAFTVSNASIFTNHLPNARRKRVGKDVPQKKRDMIYPAVLIGRLGVNSKFARRHIGTELMDSIKSWFTDEDNKTGCHADISSWMPTTMTSLSNTTSATALISCSARKSRKSNTATSRIPTGCARV